MFVYIDYDTPIDGQFAKEAAETLTQAYPGYPWGTVCRGGILQVKCYVLHGSWGMVRHVDRLSHDSGRRKKEIVKAAGELLERAGLRRGTYEVGSEYGARIEGADRRRGGDKSER